jgi:tryptophan halogenase
MMELDRAVLHDEKGNPVIDRDHAYHVENHEFVTFLESYAKQSGVEFHDDEVEEVLTDENGIAGLRLASGVTETAGLYVDCSGFRSLLVEKHLGNSFRSYDSSLLCNKAIVGGWTREDEVLKPYTTAETMDAGWCWQIEHRERINRGYVYSTEFLSDDDAEVEFRSKNPKVTDTRTVNFRSGILENPWTKNAVAVGNASGFVEPLEATALGQIAQDAQSIAEILAESDYRISHTMAKQHNHRFRRSWENIRQFLAIHYRFNKRLDTPFWKAARNDVDIAGAAEFVEYYEENGPNTLFRPTLIDRFDQFNLDGYLAMMIGQQVPHRNRYEPPKAEMEIWRRINAANHRNALRSYDCATGLEKVEAPDWQWNFEFFRQAWTEIKTV